MMDSLKKLFVRVLFDAANRVLPIIGENRGIDFTTVTIARFKVSPGSYVTLFTTGVMRGGASKSEGSTPTDDDPEFHAGIHDFTVPSECREVAFVAPTGGAGGRVWCVSTPSLITDAWP